MRRIIRFLTALAVILTMAVATVWLNHAAVEGQGASVRIVDGDSLEIDGARIRLWGVDAPELDQMCGPALARQACGREARGWLRDRVSRGKVSCAGVERDRYDRLLAVCRVAGRDINADLVASGHAVAFGAYFAEEAEARDARRGVWAGEFDQPKAWRAMKGSRAELAAGQISRMMMAVIRRFAPMAEENAE